MRDSSPSRETVARLREQGFGPVRRYPGSVPACGSEPSSYPADSLVSISAFNSSPWGIVVTDSQSIIISTNPSFRRLVGRSPEIPMKGIDIRSLIPLDQIMVRTGDFAPEGTAENTEEGMSELQALAEATVSMDREFIRLDGSRVPVRLHCWKIDDDFTGATRYGAFVWDKSAEIQERRLNEAMLNLKKAILDNVPDFVWLVDNRGRFITVNRAFADFHGKTPSDFFGRTMEEFQDFSDAELIISRDQQVLSTGKRHTFEKSFSARGVEYWFEVSKTPIMDVNGGVMGIICLARDITSRRRREQEKVTGERLRGALEMAGAVCHEINQPLQAGMGYAELLFMDAGESGGDLLAKILECLERIGELTRKLSTVTRYETRDYVFRGKKIIDIDRSAEDPE